MLNMQLAWSQTLNLWRAGALKVLVFALIVAVTAMTAVNFFTTRVDSALTQQGGLLLGGDVAVMSDHEISADAIHLAKQLDLKTVKTYEFPSMVAFQDQNQLAQIKAVGVGFPLRGDLTIGQHDLDEGQVVTHGPRQGDVWIEPRLANLLGVKVGDRVQVGMLHLIVSQLLIREPSRGGDMFNFAPRLMLHAADLPATELIQYGSRVRYQLLVAGGPRAVNQYFDEMVLKLGRGEKIQDVESARPEIKSALEKARQFLGLSALVSLILGMVAMVLSSLPYIKQSLETFALMRCFGASKKQVMQVLAWQTFFIAILAASVGILLGVFAQFILAELATQLFVDHLPPIPLAPIGVALVLSVAMMFALVLPHAWQMRHLSAMNILRRETIMPNMANHIKYLPAVVVMVVAIIWQASSIQVASVMIGVLLGIGLLMIVLAYALIHINARLFEYTATTRTLNSIKIGLLGLKRRLSLSIMQMIGFSIGLTILMLLSLLRNDLIQNWQSSLPEDAPNRFLINIQQDQLPQVNAFFRDQHIPESPVFPMIRGRLMSKNGENMQNKTWDSQRAERLAQREFNLSMAATMQVDNQLVEGRWWRQDEFGLPYLSIEQDLAQTLGIKLGDHLVFDIAGKQLDFEVKSIRKVEWDTMRANFFAVTPPQVLDEFSASYLSSFYLAKANAPALNQLVKALPNITVIDVAALLEQVRNIMQQMSRAIVFVYLFSLMAGVAVIYAALVATQETRMMEATLMRVFGSARREVAIAYITEFVVIGFVAAFVAVLIANGFAYYLSQQIFNVSFQFNWLVAGMSLLMASLFIPLVAWLGLRHYLNVTPRQLLQSI